MVSEQLVDLSRLPLSATAMHRCLFVPLALALGMVWPLVVMNASGATV